MYPSYIFGRSGGLDETTGLFVLESGIEEYDLSRSTIQMTAGSRDGYEIGSKVPFQDGMNNPAVMWIDKTIGHTSHLAEFGIDIETQMLSATNGEDTVANLADMEASLFLTHSTDKIMAKRYVKEFSGIIPRSRVIKTILRQKDIATKRVVLFGSCVDPADGGGLWLVSPHGFPWRDTHRYILDEGSPDDLRQAIQEKNFLFMAMTGAVPYISGHRHRQPDEEYPRILRIPSVNPDYLEHLDDRLEKMIGGKKGAKYTHEHDAIMVKTLHDAAEKAGKVQAKPKDLLSNGAISLTDSDILL